MTDPSAPSRGSRELDQVEIHTVLANERRQFTLELLDDADEPMSVRDLSELIATQETGENPPPRNIRQSAYVSLHQSHLPMLDDLDVVTYDEVSKSVQLGPQAHHVLAVVGNGSSTGTDEYYLLLSVAGLLLIGASRGIAILRPMLGDIFLGITLLAIATLALYRTVGNGGSYFEHLGGGSRDARDG